MITILLRPLTKIIPLEDSAHWRMVFEGGLNRSLCVQWSKCFNDWAGWLSVT